MPPTSRDIRKINYIVGKRSIAVTTELENPFAVSAVFLLFLCSLPCSTTGLQRHVQEREVRAAQLRLWGDLSEHGLQPRHIHIVEHGSFLQSVKQCTRERRGVSLSQCMLHPVLCTQRVDQIGKMVSTCPSRYLGTHRTCIPYSILLDGCVSSFSCMKLSISIVFLLHY